MSTADRFRTIVDVSEMPERISHHRHVLCAGSCFVETMGERLRDFRFNACVNPSGPLFNPASIASLLRRLDAPEPYAEADLFESAGLWHSWDHHGMFSAAAPRECLSAINTALAAGSRAFKNLDVLMLTFGTAFVYRLAATGKIVANCHKQPSSLFVRELLSVKDIVDEYARIFTRTYEMRPDACCIVTISPVRHLRDDPHENLVSKSILVCAVHELQKAFPRLYYFPAYEIMMDELRDYRFYNADMAHPNEIATDYIWEKFIEACVDEESRKFIKDYEPIRSAMGHEVMKGGVAVKKFGSEQLERVKELEKKYPDMSFEKEKKYFTRLRS
jgi:GSCFA family